MLFIQPVVDHLSLDEMEYTKTGEMLAGKWEAYATQLANCNDEEISDVISSIREVMKSK